MAQSYFLAPSCLTSGSPCSKRALAKRLLVSNEPSGRETGFSYTCPLTARIGPTNSSSAKQHILNSQRLSPRTTARLAIPQQSPESSARGQPPRSGPRKSCATMRSSALIARISTRFGPANRTSLQRGAWLPWLLYDSLFRRGCVLSPQSAVQHRMSGRPSSRHPCGPPSTPSMEPIASNTLSMSL